MSERNHNTSPSEQPDESFETPDSSWYELGGHDTDMTLEVARALVDAGLPGDKQERLLARQAAHEYYAKEFRQSGIPKQRESAEPMPDAVREILQKVSDDALRDKGESEAQIAAMRRARKNVK